MVKIAYNKCHGGFSISDEAVTLARKISGDEKWAGCTLKGEFFSDGSGPDESEYSHLPYEWPRHDPVLISVIETLGERANGMFANIGLVDLPSGSKYRIDEYDGAESVETPDSYEWLYEWLIAP